MIKRICPECGKEHNIFNLDDKIENECKGCELAQSRVYFEFRWSGGGFDSKLCDLCTTADCSNLVKLHKGFPRIVEGYISYGMGKTWAEFISN